MHDTLARKIADLIQAETGILAGVRVGSKHCIVSWTSRKNGKKHEKAVAGSPSDSRTWQNCKADVLRILREDGDIALSLQEQEIRRIDQKFEKLERMWQKVRRLQEEAASLMEKAADAKAEFSNAIYEEDDGWAKHCYHQAEVHAMKMAAIAFQYGELNINLEDAGFNSAVLADKVIRCPSADYRAYFHRRMIPGLPNEVVVRAQSSWLPLNYRE
jgi:hypothetical protein